MVKWFSASAHRTPASRAFSFVVPFPKCKCLLFAVTTDWVIRACIGGATGLKNDWQAGAPCDRCYIKQWSGESVRQADAESHCSDIKREPWHDGESAPRSEVIDMRIVANAITINALSDLCWYFHSIDFYFRLPFDWYSAYLSMNRQPIQLNAIVANVKFTQKWRKSNEMSWIVWINSIDCIQWIFHLNSSISNLLHFYRMTKGYLQ